MTNVLVTVYLVVLALRLQHWVRDGEDHGYGDYKLRVKTEIIIWELVFEFIWPLRLLLQIAYIFYENLKHGAERRKES